MHAANSSVEIHRATHDATTVAALAAILVDVVDGGASVGFLSPLTHERAERYADAVLASAARGERIVLVASDTASGEITGTVQLLLDTPENQPHRADVAKLQVRRHARGRGIASALMRAIEDEAIHAGRTLLVLDTATGSDAERLYAYLGWQRCGEIPGYALWPDGERKCNTTLFCRTLSRAADWKLPAAALSLST